MGFDCAHAGDYVPCLHMKLDSSHILLGHLHGWTIDEVIKETEEMADQFIMREKMGITAFKVWKKLKRWI